MKVNSTTNPCHKVRLSTNNQQIKSTKYEDFYHIALQLNWLDIHGSGQ